MLKIYQNIENRQLEVEFEASPNKNPTPWGFSRGSPVRKNNRDLLRTDKVPFWADGAAEGSVACWENVSFAMASFDARTHLRRRRWRRFEKLTPLKIKRSSHLDRLSHYIPNIWPLHTILYTLHFQLDLNILNSLVHTTQSIYCRVPTFDYLLHPTQ